MKIPVTGFEPFRPDAINAAREAVSRPPAAIGGAEILKRRPVEHEARPGPAESQRRGVSPQLYPLPPDGDHRGLPPCALLLRAGAGKALPAPAITAGPEAALAVIAESLMKGRSV